MQIHLSLIFLLLASHCSFAQNIAGTWHGFQVSRGNGQHNEYRVILDLKVTADQKISGTMQLKSPLKGTVTSSFTGIINKKDNTLRLTEDKILTEGITAKDATLCSYILKLRRNVLKGNGRSRAKGFDHLKLHLQRIIIIDHSLLITVTAKWKVPSAEGTFGMCGIMNNQ